MNIIVNDFSDLKNNFRIELTKKILKELKIIKLSAHTHLKNQAGESMKIESK
jgi:hypothetical protein